MYPEQVREVELIWNNFWSEVAEARELCESEYIFRQVVQNIANYYTVVIDVEQIRYK